MDWGAEKVVRRIYIIKRCIDFCFSLIGIVMFAPIFGLIIVLIRIESAGPALFLQERVGLGGRTFAIYKFRTMIHKATEIGLGLETSSTDFRITKIGKILREYHLDEMPQLINVLLGEMSMVGPRPTIPQQLKTYSTRQMERFKMLPGITGLAQISGNNELSWDQRIELDLYYIEHYSLYLDLKILYKTVYTVLKKQGLYGPDGTVRDKTKSEKSEEEQ